MKLVISRLRDVFIVSLLSLMLIPSVVPSRFRLRQWADRLACMLGVWQSPWNMFAPEPDRSNKRLLAEIEYQDGSKATWTSPDWSTTSVAWRYQYARYTEYLDAIDSGQHDNALDAFAEHLARISHPQQKDVPAKRVVISRTSADIAGPNPNGFPPRKNKQVFDPPKPWFEYEAAMDDDTAEPSP